MSDGCWWGEGSLLISGSPFLPSPLAPALFSTILLNPPYPLPSSQPLLRASSVITRLMPSDVWSGFVKKDEVWRLETWLVDEWEIKNDWLLHNYLRSDESKNTLTLSRQLRAGVGRWGEGVSTCMTLTPEIKPVHAVHNAIGHAICLSSCLFVGNVIEQLSKPVTNPVTSAIFILCFCPFQI